MEKEPLTKERTFDNIEVQGILRRVFLVKTTEEKRDSMLCYIGFHDDIEYGMLEHFEEVDSCDDR